MTDPHDIKTTINRGLAWIAAASSLVWLLDIVGMVVILAFWITPAEFGVAALAISLFPALDLAAEMGLSGAVIQRDDHTPERLATVFWINLGFSAVLCAGLVLVIGPLLGGFHGEPVVGDMLAVYGIKLLWNNVFLIPNALMRKELRFKELSAIRALSNVAEFIGKVGFAAAGFGVWCFVFGPALRALVTGIGIQMRCPWRPRLVLRLRETFDWVKFGLKTSASQVLFHLYTNADYQVVGHYFGAEANGFYRLGYELVLEPCRLIASTLIAIAYPAYSRLQYLRAQLVEQFISFTRLSMVIMLAFLSVIVVAADDLLQTFWGSVWVESAMVARILCGVGLLRALSFVIPPMLDGVGRPGLSLVYTLVASVLLPALFVVSAVVLGDRFQELSVALAWVVGYPIAFAVLVVLALDVLELTVVDYLRRVAGILSCAGAAVAVGLAIRWLAAGWPVQMRLLAVAVTTLVGFFFLLAYFQGISPRSVTRAIKGPAPTATADGE